MEQRPSTPDPNAMTQPIPVVPVAPPPRPSGAAPVTVAAPFTHRFGSVPWYLMRRLAAFALDFLALPFVFATFGFHAIEGGLLLFAGRSAIGFGTLAAASFVLAIVVACSCQAIFGTTLGKLVFALHVRRRDGRRAGGGRILVRTLAYPIDALAIGPLLALVTRRHERLGDLLAGTVVVGTRRAAIASFAGIALGAAIAYAQITYGGGLTSAVGVAAEAAVYAPSAYERAASALGIRALQPQPQPQPQTSAVPSSVPAPSGTSNV